ncbi:MAG: SurA N-terminal domain-containing protein [Novosphingobium sp.]|nr:SurA N-terminal domain-containing protein [Novosphingobium sp.]
MLQIIRRTIRSRLGAAIAIAILVLIAISFASGDVANTGSFGGLAGGDRVALVGDERIDTATLSQAATTALERAREEQPTMSMKALLAGDGLERIVDELADRLAVAVYGRKLGMLVSDRLIDSEIAKISAFSGPDGKFSEAIYRQALRQRGITEKALREDIESSLIARQVLIPASFGAIMPKQLTMRYVGLLSETREGEIAVLPSSLFAPRQAPSDKQISDYYEAHRNDFIRPERRVLRYASFDTSIVKDAATPTEAEIAALYKENAAQYRAVELRSFTQLVVPTEAAARAITAEIAKGTSLEAAARARGLSVAMLAATDRDGLARQTSKAVSDAAFAAAAGKIAAPARSALGWHVIRVDDVKSRPARTLAQVRDELVREVTQRKLNAALTEKLEQIEERLDSGSNLVELARELNAEVKLTEPITADGKIYGKAGQKVPEILNPVIETAFSMELERPQLAMIDRGTRFVIYDVTDIAPSAPAPLEEIRDDVKAAYLLDRGSAEARKLAVAIQSQVRKGASLQQAMASARPGLLPPQRVRMSRPEITQAQQQGKGVPAPVALMFQMAQGTVKVQKTDDGQAWFIVHLRKIEPGKTSETDPRVASARKELGRVAGDEYAQALRRAIREEIGVEKNPSAIRAVREQLLGSN